MKKAHSKYSAEEEAVISPFATNEVTISPNKGRRGSAVLVIGLGMLFTLGGAVTGIFLTRCINDPYRTLELFPVSKYLDQYQSLAGSKFKAEFKVDADLGWKDGAGRLMLFSTTDDSRPLAVLIPATVGKDIYFTKGQTYLAAIEVKEGGLIYADSFQKN